VVEVGAKRSTLLASLAPVLVPVAYRSTGVDAAGDAIVGVLVVGNDP
jgi:hypothetical protein